MRRDAFFALLVMLTCCATASAQQWATKMFEKTSHDFGTVARGAKVVHRFKITNIYEEAVHISNVRSSCGCTTPTISKSTIETFEVGEIVTEFNTRSFLGDKSATITVSIDRPFAAEVQLQVRGNIRRDVVLSPGLVQLGTVSQGTAVEQKVQVQHAGRGDWQVVDVQSTYPHFEVELNRLRAGAGRVGYELLVRLTSDAPPGYLNKELVLVTNDRSARYIPLAVEGRIAPALTVSPKSLYLGEVAPGEQVRKQFFVRGKQPFAINEVACRDKCFEFDVAKKSETLYLVAVTFVPEAVGKIRETVRIRTDVGKGTDLTLSAFADVREK